MEARHAFIKGLAGNGIFYRTEDFLVLITIVSVLTKEMNLVVIGFCPMFNHIHFFFKSISLRLLRSFIQKMAITFVKEYNREYDRKGSLFQKPFGNSLKKVVKIILGTVAYVFNNPVAGKLYPYAIEYKWSLLAYLKTDCPFSMPLRKRACRNAMRKALNMVDYFHSKNKYLSYSALRNIFSNLNADEYLQIIDYILSKYNFLSKDSLEELYNSIDKMLTAIDSNAGSEFDLEDEYGDHSCYRDMLRIVKKLGYKDKRLNFEAIPKRELVFLFNYLSRNTKAPTSCLKKFLHMSSVQ